MSPRSYIARWLAVILRPIHWIFMRAYFRVEVVGRARIPRSGPAILAPTHRSRWDAFALYCATGRLLRFLASRDEFVGVQGWFMRRLGAFPVDTQKPSPSTLRYCRELVLAGEALVVFPEGTIFYYAPHEVHPLKPGVAWLALDSQERVPDVPLTLVPIRLVYGDRFLRFRSRIQVLVQEPIRLVGYLDRPRKEAIRNLTAELQRRLGDVVNESLAERIPPRGADEPDGHAVR